MRSITGDWRGDFSRRTFRQEDHFTDVLQQQGRVQVDADDNERGEIWRYRLETETIDIIGPHGVPLSEPDSFEVVANGSNFTIKKGRIYIEGLLVESASDVQGEPYPDDAPVLPGNYLVYLEVWERLVTVLDTPRLREIALGGPDHATRTQVAFRPRLQRASGGGVIADCETAFDQAKGRYQPATLKASVSLPTASVEPCDVTPESGYLGQENQLYRVEIHGSQSVAGWHNTKYKWSRDNGMVTATVDGPIRSPNLPSEPHYTLTLKGVTGTGRDEVYGFTKDCLVELTTETQERQGVSGILFRVVSVEAETGILKLATQDPFSGVQLPLPASPIVRVRRWEGCGLCETAQNPVPLENGIQITFGDAQNGKYPPTFRPGDFWLIPARAAMLEDNVPDNQMGSIEWPRTNTPLDFLPPHGIGYRYAPLAILRRNGDNWTEVSDCRKKFPPLTELTCGDGCCSVTVRPADAPRLQEIVNSVASQSGPERNGKICFLPGHYRLPRPLHLTSLHRNMILEGCRPDVIIEAAPGNESTKEFLHGLVILSDTFHVSIRDLEFRPPLVNFVSAGGLPDLGSDEINNALASSLKNLFVSIGIRAVQCTALTIEGCRFAFASHETWDIFGAGVFATGINRNLSLWRNTFIGLSNQTSYTDPLRLLFGFLASPTLVIGQATDGKIDHFSSLSAALSDVVFADNWFSRVTIAVGVLADCGAIAFHGNEIQECPGGILLASPQAKSTMDYASGPTSVRSAAAGKVNAPENFAEQIRSVSTHPLYTLGNTLACLYPLPVPIEDTSAVSYEAFANLRPGEPHVAEMKNLFAAKPDQEVRTLYSRLKQRTDALFREFDSFTPGATSPTPSVAAAAVSTEVPDTIQAASAYTMLNAAVSTMDRIKLAAQPFLDNTDDVVRDLRLTLRIADNRVDTTLVSATSLCALCIIDSEQNNLSSVIVTGNLFQSRGRIPTALILFTQQNALTGNQFLNRAELGMSLYFFPSGNGILSAVTGNVLRGLSTLGVYPTRPYPVPMNTWMVFNQ